MRGKLKSAWVFAVLFFGIAAKAQAETSIHAEGSATIAYTDNLRFARKDPPAGQLGPQSAYFLTLTPGAMLIHEAERATYVLRYSHPITLYLRNEGDAIQSDVVSANGLFALSPVDELILGVNAARTRTNIATLNQAPAENVATIQQPGSITMGTLGLGEGYSHQYAPTWRGFQALDAAMVVPIDTPGPQANRYTVSNQFGAEFIDEPNAYALIARGTFFFTPEVKDVVPRQENIIVGTTGRWRRDLGRDFSSELTLGFARASKLDDFGNAYYAPTGSAALRYAEERGTAELIYARDVAPNMLMGQVYLFDRLGLNGGVPVHRAAHLFANAGVGASINRVLNMEDGHTQGSAKAYMVDCALSWAPPELGFYSSIRYQYSQQKADDSTEVALLTFARNTVMLTVGGMFPTRNVPRIPHPNAGRVDGTDRPSNMREPDFRNRQNSTQGGSGG